MRHAVRMFIASVALTVPVAVASSLPARAQDVTPAEAQQDLRDDADCTITPGSRCFLQFEAGGATYYNDFQYNGVNYAALHPYEGDCSDVINVNSGQTEPYAWPYYDYQGGAVQQLAGSSDCELEITGP